jgi:hypothetical protein
VVSQCVIPSSCILPGINNGKQAGTCNITLAGGQSSVSTVPMHSPWTHHTNRVELDAWRLEEGHAPRTPPLRPEPSLALTTQPVDLLTRDHHLTQDCIQHGLAGVPGRHPAGSSTTKVLDSTQLCISNVFVASYDILSHPLQLLPARLYSNLMQGKENAC